MKICKIWIKDWDQFKDIELDFTDPATGEPAEKICFIGSNGTGKSKLLGMIQIFLLEKGLDHSGPPAFILFQVKTENKFYIICYDEHSPPMYLKNDISFEKDWLIDFYREHAAMKEGRTSYFNHEVLEEIPTFFEKKFGFNFDFSPIIYCPSETVQNNYLNIHDVPESNLQESFSLKFDANMTNYFEVSTETIKAFWTQLIFLIEERKNQFLANQDLDENKKKSIEDFKEQFDRDNKKPLEELSKIWNKILNKANLEFDYIKAKIPIQLNDNLSLLSD